MIEYGLVVLVQNGLGTPPIAPGGFAVQLPKDLISPETPRAWTYRSINSEPSHTLEKDDPFTALQLQIDCHGLTMADAIALARAIDRVLRRFRGTLPDPEGTFVEGIFGEQGPLDGYSDSNRTYVRTVEYLVNYLDQDV